MLSPPPNYSPNYSPYAVVGRAVPSQPQVEVNRSSVISVSSTSSSASSAGSSPTGGSCPAWQPFSGEDVLSRGLSGLYQSFPQNPSLAEEMERLFVTEPRGRHNSMESDSSGEVDEEFRLNGVEIDLDDFDRRILKSRPTRAEMLGLGLRLTGELARAEDGEILTKEGLLALLARRKKNRKRGVVCVFCRNNGESELIYLSHNLKDSAGRVTCPVLRAYTCPNCGANGDTAHTIKYCPMATGEGINIRSLKTARTATGKRRSPLP